MLQGLIDNAGTIVVSLAVIAIVGLAIAKLYRDRKRGKSPCGCNCGCCSADRACQKKP